MEFTGKVLGINQDYATGTFTISFSVNESAAVIAGYDAIKDIDVLDIKAVKHRKKRSLDANSYAWVLMSKIAAHPDVRSSKEEIYEEMLRKYGFFYEDDSGYITVTVRADVDMSKIGGHWQLIKDNGTFKGYAMIKGSSEYDTREMSRFIDGIVSDAKELEIETLTPNELEEMKARWNV